MAEAQERYVPPLPTAFRTNPFVALRGYAYLSVVESETANKTKALVGAKTALEARKCFLDSAKCLIYANKKGNDEIYMPK